MCSLNSAREFLQNIVSPAENNLLEIRCISNDKKTEQKFYSHLDNAIQYIENSNGTTHIYYGMASRKSDAGGSKENCKALRTLFLDIDCGSDGHRTRSMFNTKEEALTFINSVEFPKPSIIVDSGNGLHLYWLLEEPLQLDSEGNISMVEDLMRKMGGIFAADSTCDISRIFRVPGTKNIKTDPFKECEILRKDYNLRYELNIFLKHPLIKLNLCEIKNTKKGQHNYYAGLFGKLDSWNEDDRSEIDQSIISFLVNKGFTNEEIELIFKTFPTTGKYHDHNDGQKYLQHSTLKAREYLEKNEQTSDSNTKYEIVTTGDVGYYAYTDKGRIRLTNFILELEPRVLSYRDGNPISFYSGKLTLEGKEYSFDKMDASLFADRRAFHKFIASLCGAEVYLSSDKQAFAAITHFSEGAGTVTEKKFGFTDDLTKYYTENLEITESEVTRQFNPIKYSEVWGDNKVEFKRGTSKEIVEVKQSYIDNMLFWDKPYVTLLSLAFAFFPILYPFIKNINHNKFYFMLVGTSGSGKTQWAKWLQNIYGEFINLFSFTSTSTAMNVQGSAFKDMLFIIDDLKSTQFTSQKAINSIQAVLQNYSDGTSRQRSNTDLKIKDERKIEGHLMLTAEDVIFTEASTIARGIIIDVNSKDPNFDLADNVTEASKKFSKLMIPYIQFVMQRKNNLEQLFKDSRNNIVKLLNEFENEISMDNYSRAINNFSALYTSWRVFSEFLLSESLIIKPDLDQEFLAAIKLLMKKNLEYINFNKPEVLFEKQLWDNIENERFRVENVIAEIDEKDRRPIVARYEINDGEIKLLVHFSTVYKEIKNITPELGHSSGAVKQKLLHDGKIKVVPSNKFRLNGKQYSGVMWIGSIPKHIFGVEEEVPRLMSKDDLFSDGSVMVQSTWNTNFPISA